MKNGTARLLRGIIKLAIAVGSTSSFMRQWRRFAPAKISEQNKWYTPAGLDPAGVYALAG